MGQRLRNICRVLLREFQRENFGRSEAFQNTNTLTQTALSFQRLTTISSLLEKAEVCFTLSAMSAADKAIGKAPKTPANNGNNNDFIIVEIHKIKKKKNISLNFSYLLVFVRYYNAKDATHLVPKTGDRNFVFDKFVVTK